MVRFLHISDIHLGYDQYGSRERYKDFARSLDHVVRAAIRERVDFIIIGGDLFNKKSISASTLLQADSILSRARNAGIPVIACEGNHDSLSYGESWSWLHYLARKDLIVLLGLQSGPDGVEDGDMEDIISSALMRPWDPELREGSHIELTFRDTRVRIYGFGYLGATTRRRIEELSPNVIGDGTITIGILHAGIEGYIPNMHGTVPEHALGPFKGRFDYLALGHIHKRFEIDNWVFNPGSTENCSLEEAAPNNPHGYYLVDITPGDSEGAPAVVCATFTDGSGWRRPFHVISVDLTGVSAPDEIMGRTMESIPCPGNTSGLGTSGKIRREKKTTPRPLRSRVDPATLDAFMGGEGVPDKHHQSDTINQGWHEGQMIGGSGEGDTEPGAGRKIPPDLSSGETGNAVGDTMETSSAGSEESPPGGVTRPPVVIVRLRGITGIRDRIDTADIREHIMQLMHPEPLYLEVRDETSREGYVVEQETSATRSEFERQVIREILAGREFGAYADQLHTLIEEFRKAMSPESEGDLSSFDVRVRELAEELVSCEDETGVR